MILITKTSDQTRQRGVCVCVCVFPCVCSFVLTSNRALTIPSNINDCISGKLSHRGTKINRSHTNSGCGKERCILVGPW